MISLNLSELNLDRCVICQESVALPCKLRTSCNCRIYFCLTCARLMLIRNTSCPLCRSPVHYETGPMGSKYDWQSALWQLNDILPVENRFLRSVCSQCNAGFSTQRDLHVHLNNTCPHSITKCTHCGLPKIKIGELQAHYNICPRVRKCWRCEKKLPYNTRCDCIELIHQLVDDENHDRDQVHTDRDHDFRELQQRLEISWKLVRSKIRHGRTYAQIAKSLSHQ